MTPETPDPPPVSPKEIEAIQKRFERSYPVGVTDIRHDGSPVYTQMGDPVADVGTLLAARAADALRHQQELEGQAELIARANQRAVELRAALSTAEATIQQCIDVLDERTRALHFQPNTASNLPAVIAAICDTDTRHAQELFKATSKLEAAEATIASLTADKVFLDRCWNAACAMAADLRAERDRLSTTISKLDITRDSPKEEGENAHAGVNLEQLRGAYLASSGGRYSGPR